MALSPRSQLLTLAVVLAAVVGGGLWWLGSGPAPDAPRPVVAAPSAERAAAPAPDPAPAREDPLSVPLETPTRDAPRAPAPLTVDLELLWARPAEVDARTRPWGSGRGAVLEGRLADARGQGVAAEVSIVAGPNAGRSTRADAEGAYRMDDLLGGRAIVRIQAPAIVGARRDVLLGAGKTTTLNLGFGRPASVTGRVTDLSEEPIAGAEVNFDGQIGFTTEDGHFSFPRVASGPVLVEVSAEGYAARFQKVNVTAGMHVTGDRLAFRLEEGCALNVAARESPGSSDPVQVYLFPSRPDAQTDFPWHRVNPIELRPGSTRRVPDLPPESVHVRAFHRGAAAETELVALRKGRDVTAVLEFEPGARIAGRVTSGAGPAPGARVRLEAPDRERALLAYFRLPKSVLWNQLLPTLPPAFQETVTGADGRFLFTAFRGGSERYYLEARGPSGRTWAGRVAVPGETDLELALEPLTGGNAWLDLDLGARALTQVVELRITGREEAEERLVGPGERLLVEGLREGHWRLSVAWPEGELVSAPRLALPDDSPVGVPLPPELSGLGAGVVPR